MYSDILHIGFSNVKLVLEGNIVALDIRKVANKCLVVLDDLAKSLVLGEGEVKSGFIVVAHSQESGAFSSGSGEFSSAVIVGFSKLVDLKRMAINDSVQVRVHS